MEIEAEMNATVVLGISSDVVCISHKRATLFFFLFVSRLYIYIYMHFFFLVLYRPLLRESVVCERGRQRERERERDIYADIFWLRVPKSVSNAVIRKAIRLERESYV